METHHIVFIRRVAELRNISAAARDLGMTQPALTKIVSRVEDQVGAQLFDRGPRGVVLTPMGQLFLDRMSRVELEMQNLSNDVRTRRAGVSGTVSLAVGQFWLNRILPKVIARLNADAPDIQVRVTTGTRDELMDRVKAGTSDVMLARITEDAPEGLSCEKLAEVRMYLVARADHPLAALNRSVEPEELADYGWILPPRTDPTIRYAFTEFGLEPPVASVETVSRQLIDGLLLESDFLTVIPSIEGSRVETGLTRIRADWLGWTAQSGIFLARDRALLPCCHRFLDVLREEMSHTDPAPRPRIRMLQA